MPNIGKIVQGNKDRTKASFLWTIPYFSSIPNEVGTSESSSMIKLEFKKVDLVKPFQLWIGVRKADGLEQKIVTGKTLTVYQEEYTENNFLNIADLFSQKSKFLPSDVLTITFTIHCKALPSTLDDYFIQNPTTASSSHERSLSHYQLNISDDEDYTNHFRYDSSDEEDFINRNTKRLCSDASDDEDYIKPKTKRLRSDIIGLTTMQKHFKELYLSGENYDIIIKVKSKEFKAHKIVLQARSPVFSAMFKSKMKESEESSIKIDDCDPEVFDKFLMYLYTGQVENLTSSNAMGLYCAGDKYDFSELKVICVNYLKDCLSTDVLLEVITLARRHDEKDLLEQATSFFSKNYEEILETEEWNIFLKSDGKQATELFLEAMKMNK